MKKRNIILLTILIVLMCAVIVVELIYLYPPAHNGRSDVNLAPVEQNEGQAAQKTERKSAQAEPEAKKPEAANTEASKADTPEAKVPKTEAPKEDAAKPEPAAKPAAKQDKLLEFKVKNSATNKINTLRQNADNSLSLLDHNGKSLWKIAFPGPIVGNVEQIDIYSNLKIQYLIAEGSKLHLIDRLGREVKNFPLALGSKALGGPEAVKQGQNSYWSIKTEKGTVYFDRKNVKILNQLPK